MQGRQRSGSEVMQVTPLDHLTYKVGMDCGRLKWQRMEVQDDPISIGSQVSP